MDKKVAARVLERDQHRCQFPTNDRKCGNSNIHLHHRLLRSQGGQDVDDNLIALCKNHHDWAHDNSEDARLLGLIIKTGDDPDRHHWMTVPIPEDGYETDEQPFYEECGAAPW